jgi:hypothetical protein
MMAGATTTIDGVGMRCDGNANKKTGPIFSRGITCAAPVRVSLASLVGARLKLVSQVLERDGPASKRPLHLQTFTVVDWAERCGLALLVIHCQRYEHLLFSWPPKHSARSRLRSRNEDAVNQASHSCYINKLWARVMFRSIRRRLPFD